MSARISVNAKCVDIAVGTVDSGRFKGKRVEIRLWDGYASKGFISAYKLERHRWVDIEIEGGIYICRTFTGKNLSDARSQLNKLRKLCK